MSHYITRLDRSTYSPAPRTSQRAVASQTDTQIYSEWLPPVHQRSQRSSSLICYFERLLQIADSPHPTALPRPSGTGSVESAFSCLNRQSPSWAAPATVSQTMSSTQRFFSSLLVGLAATCSLISMSLSAWHIAFVNNPPGGSRAPLAIRYWEPATSENLTSLMPYVPSRWTMRDLHALVATGTIGTIGGSLAAVLQWTAYPTGQQKSRESEKVSETSQHLTCHEVDESHGRSATCG